MPIFSFSADEGPRFPAENVAFATATVFAARLPMGKNPQP
jgi:hypothetical protein